MSELPEDLLEEILCLVPATSLIRLRSTCKRWNRLFNDERFTRKQFNKAAKQSTILMLKESRECSIMRINLHRYSPEVIAELSLTDVHSSLDQLEIRGVSHCDGLLLGVCLPKDKEDNTRLVVWNPCTRQTRWIINSCHKDNATHALGSYQDNDSNDNISYKILSRMGGYGDKQEFGIYEMNSESWRILDVTIDFSFLAYIDCGVSLKGKTYWIASDEKEGHRLGILLLVSFDFTTERFERCLCFPGQYPRYWNMSLSAVREEKLSVLVESDRPLKTEIWLTNKIGETKVVSWSMFFAVDLGPKLRIWQDGSFWIDEEKKVLVCYEEKRIHIVGEDNKVRTEDLDEVGSSTFNYVPSLIRI